MSDEAIRLIRDQRVQLNAMTSRQLVDFVENKLQQHGITKVIPDEQTLADTYRLFVKSNQLSEVFDEAKENLENETSIKVPDDLATKVGAKLQEQPEITWHRAVRLIVDPDAPPDNEDEGDDDGNEPEDDEDDG